MSGKIIFIGTNTFPVYRESTNFLIDIPDKLKLLAECCGSLAIRLSKLQYRIEEIDNLFLSHIHGDHTIGVPIYFHGYWTAKVTGREIPERINIFATSDVYEKVLAISKTIFDTQMKGLENMVELNHIDIAKTIFHEFDRETSLTFFKVEHSVPTFGFRLEMKKPKLSIVYAPDTRPIDTTVKIATNADILIHDAFCGKKMHEVAKRTGHSTAEEAGKVASIAHVKKLVLIHMLQAYQGRETELIAEASNVFDGEVILPDDLYVIEI